MDKKRGNYNKHNKPKKVQEIDENNPVLKMFKDFSLQLDEKHDRYERIVKLSRDITIESKRIIFLLHNQDTDIESKKDGILQEADKRLKQLIDVSFKAIAVELQGQDHYQFLRAYTAGMQEFIEALLFYQYIKDDTIQQWHVINDKFSYTTEEGARYTFLFPQMEFILGLADFTGELMRKCINSIGSGQVDACFKICGFVKHILSGFMGTNNTGHKEVGRKLYTLKQSLQKMEMVCYNIRVRGSEVPKHMLAIVSSGHMDDINDDDEGFY